MYRVERVPVAGAGVDAHTLACPVTDQVRVPVGAPRPLTPVTKAENVIAWPTDGEVGIASTKIDGVATVRLIAISVEVALK